MDHGYATTARVSDLLGRIEQRYADLDDLYRMAAHKAHEDSDQAPKAEPREQD